jgi:hypothetical protein
MGVSRIIEDSFALRAAAGSSLALANDREEQFLERCGGVVHFEELALVAFDDGSDLCASFVAETLSLNLSHVAHFEQRLDAAKLL